MTAGEPRTPARLLLVQAYAAYSRQDAEGLLALVGDEVDWPDDDGGRLHGKAALRAYWTEQWARTRTVDEPVAFTALDDSRVAVDVDQQVRSPDGSLLRAGRVRHLHRIEGDRIVRMDTASPRPA